MSLLQYQNGQNGGKCGICGDPWGKPNPENEAGGKYANGIITRTYTEGQVRHDLYLESSLLSLLMFIGQFVACRANAMHLHKIAVLTYHDIYANLLKTIHERNRV